MYPPAGVNGLNEFVEHGAKTGPTFGDLPLASENSEFAVTISFTNLKQFVDSPDLLSTLVTHMGEARNLEGYYADLARSIASSEPAVVTKKSLKLQANRSDRATAKAAGVLKISEEEKKILNKLFSKSSNLHYMYKNGSDHCDSLNSKLTGNPFPIMFDSLKQLYPGS